MDNLAILLILLLIGYGLYKELRTGAGKKTALEPPPYGKPKPWNVNIRDRSALLKALRTTEELNDVYRHLAGEKPAALPYLADGLINLAGFYRYLGRGHEALTPSEEAVEIYRKVVDTHPGEPLFLSGLARSLHNLGERYDESGRGPEALERIEESVAITRKLAENQPGEFLADLAGCLNTLGIGYDKSERHREALAAAGESAAIYRKLAEDDPSAYRPCLAGSLTNLGRRHIRSDLLAAAGYAEESVSIYRALAKDGAAFAPDLARSLINLAGIYKNLGRNHEALRLCEESAAIRRKLAEDNPAAFSPALARSLTLLADVLHELGDGERAEKIEAEAAALSAASASEKAK